MFVISITLIAIGLAWKTISTSVLFYKIVLFILFSFSALTLLVGRHEGHVAFKRLGVGFGGDGLTGD